jgi:hypothetical protein
MLSGKKRSLEKDVIEKSKNNTKRDTTAYALSDSVSFKKRLRKEKAIVAGWVQLILASSEHNNFIAKAVDIHSNTPIEMQSVNNVLGTGMSLSQLYRDRAKLHLHYRQGVTTHLEGIRVKTLKKWTQGCALISYIDDCTEGWNLKFMNHAGMKHSFMKTLVIITYQMIEHVPRILEHPTIALRRSFAMGIIDKELKQKKFKESVDFKYGYLTALMTSISYKNIFHFANTASQSSDFQMHTMIRNHRKTLSYSQLELHEMNRTQGNAVLGHVEPISFKSFQEQAIALMLRLEEPMSFNANVDGHELILGDHAFFSMATKLQYQILVHGWQHGAALFKKSSLTIYERVRGKFGCSDEKFMKVITNASCICDPLHSLKINPGGDMAERIRPILIDDIYHRTTGNHLLENKLPIRDSISFLGVISAAWFFIRNLVLEVVRRKRTISATYFLYLMKTKYLSRSINTNWH